MVRREEPEGLQGVGGQRQREVDIRFTVAECRSWGYCVSGQKLWCEKQGVNFKDFLRNGMTLAQARTFVDDAVAEDVIARVLKREGL